MLYLLNSFKKKEKDGFAREKLSPNPSVPLWRNISSTGPSSKTGKVLSVWEGESDLHSKDCVTHWWKCYLRGKPLDYGTCIYLCTAGQQMCWSLCHIMISNHHWKISAPLQQVKTSGTDQQTRTPLCQVLQNSDCPRGFLGSGIAGCRCCCNTELDGSGTDFSPWSLADLTPKDWVGPWTGSGHCGHLMVLLK